VLRNRLGVNNAVVVVGALITKAAKEGLVGTAGAAIADMGGIVKEALDNHREKLGNGNHGNVKAERKNPSQPGVVNNNTINNDAAGADANVVAAMVAAEVAVVVVVVIVTRNAPLHQPRHLPKQTSVKWKRLKQWN
jgi:hypothetical protein